MKVGKGVAVDGGTKVPGGMTTGDRSTRTGVEVATPPPQPRLNRDTRTMKNAS